MKTPELSRSLSVQRLALGCVAALLLPGTAGAVIVARFDAGDTDPAQALQSTFVGIGISNAGGSSAAVPGPLDASDGLITLRLAAGTTLAAATAKDVSGNFNSTANIVPRDRGTPSANAGSFTYSNVYRDFLTANFLGIQLSGLTPSSQYAITFYAYDNSGNRTQTFTDITPGGTGNSGTVTYTSATSFTSSTSNDVFATTVNATSDASGRLFFSESGVGTGGSSNVAVFNGLVVNGALAPDETPPTLAPSDIVDDRTGGPVTQGTLVTYTVTFSEDMNAATVDASDFGNAGDAIFTIGTVTEISPGVFSVPVTPTGTGSLRLQVNQDAVLSDVVGNHLVTTAAILDDTTITVELPSGEPELVAYYPFDTDYNDASVYANHGTLTDVGTIGNSGITTATGEFKFGGGALNLGGGGDKVVPAKAINLTAATTGDWSVAFWAKNRAVANNSGGMIVGDTTDTMDFIWVDSATTGLRFRNTGNQNANFNLGGEDALWHHYVVIASDTDGDGLVDDITLYRDNTLVGTVNNVTGNLTINAIGHGYNADWPSFDGQIDELFLYSKAIDATKIAELYAGAPDETIPTLVGIVDDRAGGPVAPGSLVTYTVTFSKDMDDATVAADDFGNAGTAPTYTIGTVTETSPGVLRVPVTPTSTGTLRLQINQNAILSDPAGRNLDTSVALLDDTTILVETDITNPTLAAGDIQDDRSGGPVIQGTKVTYTLSFSEDIDHNTVDAGDFGNAGTATFTIGLITEVSPGVFEVEITPNSAGTLQLKILSGAGITDAAGNPLDTSAAIVSETVITVQEGFNPAGVKRLRVVFVAGQSNADGRTSTSELPTSPVNLQQPQNDVDFFYRVESTIYPLTTLRPGLSETGGFGPEITCGRYLADELADGITTRIAIIKYANGGTNLYSQWAGGGTGTTSGDGSEYVRFQQTVTAGLAALASTYPNAAIELVGMVWLQGESDSGTQAVNYQTNLTNFIADVRLTYGADLRFVVIRLSDGQTAVGSLATIRAAQTAVAEADPLTGLVNSDGFGMKSDNLHFNGLGQQQNGVASAIQLLNLYPFLSPLQIGPAGGGNLKLTVNDAFNGFVYALKSSETMQAGDWELEEVKTAAGNIVDFTVTPSGPKRFYRAERSLAP